MFIVDIENFPKSSFTEFLSNGNNLNLNWDSPFKWCFEKGMLYGDDHNWWADKKLRAIPHEGVDFRYYFEGEKKKYLKALDFVYAFYDGLIVEIERDFLGFTLWVKHFKMKDGVIVYGAYGHILPENVIFGSEIYCNQYIGRIAPDIRWSKVPSHMHVSIFVSSKELAAQQLNWNSIQQNKEILFIDPLRLISGVPEYE